MRPLYLILLLVGLLGFTSQLSAQWMIQLQVIDQRSSDPLPFVYAQLVSCDKGQLTDLDGRLNFRSCPGPDSLRLSYVGYRPLTIPLNGHLSGQVKLVPEDVELTGITIFPGVNPAHRIVRLARQNRSKNDPKRFRHYQYTSYNKLGLRTYPEDSLTDSNGKPIDLFLTETVTEMHRRGREIFRERILSSKISGYPGKALPLTAEDIQDATFYENELSVLGEYFLSPIAPGAFQNYSYELLYVIPKGQDSLFTISFEPRRAAANAFRGKMNIHSGTWAVVSVEADLVIGEATRLIQAGNIRQVYQQFQDSIWLPAQLNTEVLTLPFSEGGDLQFKVTGLSALSDHRLESPSNWGKIGPEKIILEPGAGEADSLLSASRTSPLSERELRTYSLLDSIGEQAGLPWLFDQLYKLQMGRIGLGPVDLELNALYTTNLVERHRPGLGLRTNERISRRFFVRGSLGYGIRDREWKHQQEIRITPFGDHRLYGGLLLRKDLVESGGRRLALQPNAEIYLPDYRDGGLRAWFLETMEYQRSEEAYLGLRLRTNLALRAFGRRESVASAGTYAFDGNQEFDFEEVGATLRWGPGEVYAFQDGMRMLIRNQYPVFWLRLVRGNETRTATAYQQVESGISVTTRLFRGQSLNFHLRGGWNSASLPLSRTHVFRGSFAPRNYTDIPLSYATMRYAEFSADRYANAFVEFSPQFRWLRVGRFRPQFTFLYNAGWGSNYANSINLHYQFDFQAPESVFQEVGFRIQNILPIPKEDNLLASYLRGIGIGGYLRIGSYAYPDFRDNLAFRLSFRL